MHDAATCKVLPEPRAAGHVKALTAPILALPLCFALIAAIGACSGR